MSRGAAVVMVAAVLVGLAVAAGIVLVGTQGDDAPALTGQAVRSPSDERAPEAEDPSSQGLDQAERVARAFLDGYLPLIYAQPGTEAEDVRHVTPRLLAQLRAQRVPPAQAALRPDLERVTVAHEGANGALAVAHVKDSTITYPLIFHLEDTPQGWLVTRIGGD